MDNRTSIAVSTLTANLRQLCNRALLWLQVNTRCVTQTIITCTFNTLLLCTVAGPRTPGLHNKRTRRVNDVDIGAIPLCVGSCRLNCDASLPFQFHEIHRCSNAVLTFHLSTHQFKLCKFSYLLTSIKCENTINADLYNYFQFGLAVTRYVSLDQRSSGLLSFCQHRFKLWC